MPESQKRKKNWGGGGCARFRDKACQRPSCFWFWKLQGQTCDIGFIAMSKKKKLKRDLWIKPMS